MSLTGSSDCLVCSEFAVWPLSRDSIISVMRISSESATDQRTWTTVKTYSDLDQPAVRLVLTHVLRLRAIFRVLRTEVRLWDSPVTAVGP